MPLRSSYQRRRGEETSLSECLEYVLEPESHFSEDVDYAKARAEWGNYVLQGLWTGIYEENDDSLEPDGRSITSELIPSLAGPHIENDESVNLSQEQIEFIRDFDIDTKGQHIRTDSDRYQEMLNQFEKEYNEGPDTVLGIHSGGLMPMSLASAYFDIPFCVVNYSPHNEEEIQVMPQSDRILVDSEHILVVDDFIETGETKKTVLDFVEERDVERKDWIAVYSINDEFQHNELLLDQ